ncbi:MAG: acetyl-CoA acetyltransferase [Acidimicrobiales bacterium]|nr:acetyl-CoA acetyltransferase [Acidimicrobiales bacterium]
MVKVVDPRTPVIVGVGQADHRGDPGAEGVEPVELIARAARAAAADSGGRDPLGALDAIRVVKLLSWRYRDPGRLIAERIGARPRQSWYTTDGGQTPQALLNHTARDITAGDLDLALLCGGEAWRTRSAYRARDEKPPWTREDPDTPEAEPFGDPLDMIDAAEAAQGLVLPVQMYAIFEVALRAAAGRSPAEHLAHLGRLWSGFSEVAAANRHAWSRSPMTAEEVVAPTAANRRIGYPYTLVMNSNNNVDQAAALLVCSAEKAASLGVPRDRWVFPVAGAEANDRAHVSPRRDLCSSPAIRAAGRALFTAAGVGPDDLDLVDLYSCFPSAVQIAAGELGLGTDRPLTVTGGMGFAGGPWNNYVTHGIATMAEALRAAPGSLGLCTGNGGFTTKHALGLYATEPPSGGFRHAVTQAEADAEAGPARGVAPDDHDGPVTVEAYTVMHDRDGRPEVAIVAALLPDGRRTWGTARDDATMATLVGDEGVGRAARRHRDGRVELL